MMLESFIRTFERRAKSEPDLLCFIDADGGEEVSYGVMRDRSLRLVLALHEAGLHRGGLCVTDMGNCPSFIYLLMAAALGGFGVVALNARLTETEKQERISQIQRHADGDLLVFDEAALRALLAAAEPGSASAKRGRKARAEQDPAIDANKLMMAMQRALANANDDDTACVMFTSGTQGRPKAANLRWRNVLGAAAASNKRLSQEGDLWQLALPLYHVGGMQVVFRSLLGGNAFALYRSFDAARILSDAQRWQATHISVVDKMLADLLAADARMNAAAASATPSVLASYDCVLLGGAAPNPALLQRCVKRGVRLYASYGATETCSQVANALVGASYEGVLFPLDGYELAIVDPDENGFGTLAVRGPGVIDGYLNARANRTADGFLLTGDTARAQGAGIQVAERTDDLFVSGGENVYPQEIRGKINLVPGVADSYVFGIEDERWGRRPVAFVERASDCRLSDDDLLAAIRSSLQVRLSPVYMPDHMVVLGAFPRTGIGKVDAQSLRQCFAERVQVGRVQAWRVKQPLVRPMRTARATVKHRESLLVRVTGHTGAFGIGESVSFDTAWYYPETIDQDVAFLRDVLVPFVLGRPILDVRLAASMFAQLPGAASRPLACAALENALWDLHAHQAGASLRALIGGRERLSEPGAVLRVPSGCVPGGAVVGMGKPAEVVAQVNELVEAGYSRVKLKVKPGQDLAVVQAVRRAHPLLTIALDANQSYKDTQVDVLQEMASYKLAFIEEPLRPDYWSGTGPRDLPSRLARLQENLSALVCLDESWDRGEQLYRMLEEHPQLRCVSMKLGKFGGLMPALEFYAWARERGIQMWPGGMYDTGVSKRLHAAFATLPGVQNPGDISESARYFAHDVCNPPFALPGGMLELNPPGFEAGIGCSFDDAVLERLAVESWTWE